MQILIKSQMPEDALLEMQSFSGLAAFDPHGSCHTSMGLNIGHLDPYMVQYW